MSCGLQQPLMKTGVSVSLGLMTLEVKHGMFSLSCGEVYDED